MGYHHAGFDEIYGVDIKPHPRYPFHFVRGDVFDVLEQSVIGGEIGITMFDAIHASPPCQAYSVAWNMRKREHPKLINRLRDSLVCLGIPYVIENVPNAPLRHVFRLCGTVFGLTVSVKGTLYELRRHRLFESSIGILAPPCRHRLPVIGIYGHGESKPMRDKRGFQISDVTMRRQVMSMPWANRDEIAEAIPPAYTEFIGRQLLEALQ